jgi:hypothetical protein
MDVNEHETIQHHTQTPIEVKEQFVVKKDMDVNEHESVMLYSLSCSFTSICV